jgi:pimeloyl-ACP methyl ester carboxylesterase
MEEDVVGASWAPGGVMRAPNRMNYGWKTSVENIKAPTLVLLGEFDSFEHRLDAWKGLKVEQKVFIRIACGSHFLQYERNRKVLHEASRQWLQDRFDQRQKAGYDGSRRRGQNTVKGRAGARHQVERETG